MTVTKFSFYLTVKYEWDSERDCCMGLVCLATLAKNWVWIMSHARSSCVLSLYLYEQGWEWGSCPLPVWTGVRVRELSFYLYEQGWEWGICPSTSMNRGESEGFVLLPVCTGVKLRDLSFYLYEQGWEWGICPSTYIWTGVRVRDLSFTCMNRDESEGFVLLPVWTGVRDV